MFQLIITLAILAGSSTLVGAQDRSWLEDTRMTRVAFTHGIWVDMRKVHPERASASPDIEGMWLTPECGVVIQVATEFLPRNVTLLVNKTSLQAIHVYEKDGKAVYEKSAFTNTGMSITTADPKDPYFAECIAQVKDEFRLLPKEPRQLFRGFAGIK